jgi:hypothetical protein
MSLLPLLVREKVPDRADEGPRAASLHREVPRPIAFTLHAQTSRGHKVFQNFGDALFAGGGVAAFEACGEGLPRLNMKTATAI